MSDYMEEGAVELSEYAIVVNPQDNVAVVRRPTVPGLRLRLADGWVVCVREAIPPGHRFALRAIPAGELVRQYGQPIGTSCGIAAGQWVTHANMRNDVPVVRELPEDLYNPPPDYFPAEQCARFRGFVRADGRVGTRNYVLVIPTSMCASHEAQQIATLAEQRIYQRAKYPHVDGVVAIPHNKGCGCQEGTTLEVLLRVLANYAAHPNVGAVLLIELGCEKTNLARMERWMRERAMELPKPVARIGIQEVGGTRAAVERGLGEVERLLERAERVRRTEVSVSELVVGVKCGGSDGFSGLSANPAVGHAVDLLVRSGGTALMSEVPEFCGAEHLLAWRARDAATGRAVYRLVDWYKEYASKFGAELNENPSPGNVAGGLLNITIKSLGAIAKGGTTRVEGVLEYGERVKGRGLWLMQGPGYDQESTPGLVAAGASLVLFTTGRGTTIGNAIAPVVKVASNRATYERMKWDIDLSAGTIIDGEETIEEAGRRFFDHMLRVASGEVMAKAEENGHREFQVWAEQAVSL
ncbi:MAG: galactonate dehydratase [Pyrinomonas sp.]|uniref:UxaA family hydrolase n=1 Tax=Pyrinomonas sp. TaxID=2080306 RepID=UPI00331EC52F